MTDPLEQADRETDDERRHAPVVIIGGGPVGLSLALGLAHHGVRSIVIEQDTETTQGSKAFGVWGRTMEVFEDWGLDERLRSRGDALDQVAPVDIRTERPIFTVDFTLLAEETAVPGLVLLPQSQTEAVLREAIAEEERCDVVLGRCVDAGQHDGAAWADVEVEGERQRFWGEFVVGADGSRSIVRESQGVRHRGRILPIDLLVYDVELEDDARAPIRLDVRRKGLLAALRFAPGQWRVLTSWSSAPVPTPQPTEGPPPRRPDVPVEELSPQVQRLFGDVPHRVTWQSQTTLYQQRVPRFRMGRLILAGDSAHLISPAGGQGMNQGIHDAENLAWTLAAVLGGADADAMLDSYDAERLATADTVARRAHVNSLLEFSTPPWIRPPGFLAMRMLLWCPPAARMVVRRLSMRDLRYRRRDSRRLVGRHRAVGRRMPDAHTVSGGTVASALRGRPGVISIGVDPPSVPTGVTAVRVDSPVRRLGLRRGAIVVVRPDRHIAAVMRAAGDRLADVLEQTCGVVPGDETVSMTRAAGRASGESS